MRDFITKMYDTIPSTVFLICFVIICWAIDRLIRKAISEFSHRKPSNDQYADQSVHQSFIDGLHSLLSNENSSVDSLSLIYLNISNLTDIEESFGRQVADDIIKSVTKVIQSSLGDDDMFTPWNDSDFIISLTNTTLEKTSALGKNIRSAVYKINFKEELRLSIYVGVSEHKKDEAIQEWFQRVEEALSVTIFNQKNG